MSCRRALLIIDNEPIREKALKDCRAIINQRDKVMGELHRFNQSDRPAFDRWFNKEFGALLTEARETAQKASELRQVIQIVEVEAMLGGAPCWRAYRNFKKARIAEKNGHGAEHKVDDDADADFDNDPDDKEAPSPDKRWEEEIKRHFRNIFGFSEEEAEEAFRDFSRRGCVNFQKEGSPEPEPRLKEIYRMLVRRLHPDLQEKMDDRKRDLWHAVQDAYRTRDLERLDTILAQCDIEEGALSPHTPVSRLQCVWMEIKDAINALNRELRKARNEPSWRFSGKSPDEIRQTRDHLERGLRETLLEHVTLRDKLQAIIDEWEAIAFPPPLRDRSSPPKRRRRDRAGVDERQTQFAFG